MQKNIAILAGKTASRLSKIAGGKGSAITGVAALKIEPNIVKKIAHTIPYKVFVTGTNGKTTTSNLIAHILKIAGKRVLHNQEGANMITGIASTLVNQASLSGKIDAEYGVFEIDEASLPKVAKQIHPEYLVCTNFFRDQLDRYGELDLLIDHMEESLKEMNTTLVLNGDDPFVMRFSLLDQKQTYFGLSKDSYTFDQYEMGESKFCPKCGKELQYQHVHYGQLGLYTCECGFGRKTPKYECQSVTDKQDIHFTVNGYTYTLYMSGVYNVYNALAAISVLKELGIDSATIQKGLNTYKIENGRMQSYDFNGTEAMLNLIKNPAGANSTVNEFVKREEKQKQFVFFLSDLPADGEDVSWIWDVDFEKLNKEGVSVVCGGRRAYDAAIRMKYAGIDEKLITVKETREEAVKYALEQKQYTYFVPSYTNLEPVKQILDSLAK